jgi:hypothetical protein
MSDDFDHRLRTRLPHQLVQSSARNHELAHQVHQRVETLGVDAYAAAGINAG